MEGTRPLVFGHLHICPLERNIQVNLKARHNRSTKKADERVGEEERVRGKRKVNKGRKKNEKEGTLLNEWWQSFFFLVLLV